MLIGRFWSSKAGNFASMLGVAVIPLILGAGVAIDYSRMLRAQGHLQSVADAAALSLAAAKLEDDAAIDKQADAYVQANFDPSVLDSVTIEKADRDGEKYEVAVSGKVPAYFMSLANIKELNVDALAVAVRGVTGSVEVALVLDNTYSMTEADSKGVTKIAALRSAASGLVKTLHEDDDANVRIAVVPYAEYVNVGTSHRHDSWISVKEDYSVTSPPPDDCGVEKERTYDKCVAWGPYRTCTRERDGVVESYSCRDCTSTEKVTEKYTPSCEVDIKHYYWFGCVGSRTDATLHLTDASPNVPYPGYVERSQRCPTPILPLTADEAPVQDAIAEMTADPGYVAYTYIPAGLMWGLNVLSPAVPFDEGKAYDADNKDPRKVVVLMTDGENTRRYRQSDGKHVAFSDTTQLTETNNDTESICKTLKARNIEVFSIAFLVDSVDAKSLLQACATDTQHYFDATDSKALDNAFGQIANALTNVRLAR